MNNLSIIFLLIIGASYSNCSEFTCQKVFPEEKLAFDFRTPFPEEPTNFEILLKNGQQLNGQLLTHPCNFV